MTKIVQPKIIEIDEEVRLIKNEGILTSEVEVYDIEWYGQDEWKRVGMAKVGPKIVEVEAKKGISKTSRAVLMKALEIRSELFTA